MPEPETKPVEINLKDVEAYLSDKDDGKTWLSSQIDTGVTKGINTFKDNFMTDKFPQLLEEEVTKRLPAPETDEAKRLKELEIKFTQSELDKNKATLQTTLLKVANTEKIPTFFVDYAIAETEETSITRLKELGTKYVADVNAAVEDRLKGKGRPAPGTGKDEDNITLNTLKDIRNIGDIQKNKAAIEALLKEAQAQ